MATFSEVPSANRSPAVYGEIDPIGQPGTEVPHVLLIGYRLAAGALAALTLQALLGATDGDLHFGVGAQLAEMARAFKAKNRNARVTAIAVDEPAAGTASSGLLVFANAATSAGTIAVLIAGRLYQIGVEVGDTPTEMGDALVAALAADTRAAVTGVNTTGSVALTAKHKGVYGDGIDIRVGYRGEALPDAVTATVTPMAGGAGQADMSEVVAALGAEKYDSIVTGLADDASLDELEAEVDRRWLATVMLDGHVFAGAVGTHGALTTLGAGRNSPSSTLIGAGASPTPPWVIAAQAAAAEIGISDPGLPLFGETLPDVLAPALSDRFDQAERNLLLYSGISTIRVDSGGRVVIDRLITTSQRNSLGVADATWYPLTVRRTMSFLRFDWVALVAAKYGQKKLADDGTVVDPGVPVVTPSVLRGEALAWYRLKIRQGHAEDFDAFAASLSAQRPSGDPERVDIVQEPNVTNELVTIATLFNFRN